MSLCDSSLCKCIKNEWLYACPHILAYVCPDSVVFGSTSALSSVSSVSLRHIQVLIWHSQTWKDSLKHSLPFMLHWLPPDILVVKKQFRSIDLGKGLAAAKTGKSMVSTEMRSGTQVHNSSLTMKSQCRKRELSDSQSAENHMLQAASAAPAESKLSVAISAGVCTVVIVRCTVSLCLSLCDTHMHTPTDKAHFFTLGISFDQQWLINVILNPHWEEACSVVCFFKCRHWLQ